MGVDRRNVSLPERMGEWLDDNGISLSEYVQGKIREDMGGDIWDIDELVHEPGVTIGRHAEMGDRVIVDRFRSPRDYNVFVGGQIGAGKTHGAAYHLSQRTHFDNGIVYIDPLANEEVETRLDTTRIEVGGDMGLNPLRIEPFDDVPSEVASQIGGRIKRKLLKSFFASLSSDEMQDHLSREVASPVSHELESTLMTAVDRAYDQVGIDLDDPSTYSRESPTIQGHLIAELSEMRDEPDFTWNTAERLLDILSPLTEGGELEQFGGKSELVLTLDPTVQLTFAQMTIPADTVMPLLFSEAYEWSKQSGRQSVLAVDEGRFLIRTSEGQTAMQQVLRHARTHDTSIQLHAHTLEPFNSNTELMEHFSHKLLYHYEDLDDEQAELLGLSPEQAQFVRHARPGNQELGYAEAALKTPDREWFPLRIATDAR